MLKVLKFEKKFDSKFQWLNFCDGEVALCTILLWWRSNQTSVSVETLMRYSSVIERHAKKWRHQGFVIHFINSYWEPKLWKVQFRGNFRQILFSTNMPSKQVLICWHRRLNLKSPFWSFTLYVLWQISCLLIEAIESVSMPSKQSLNCQRIECILVIIHKKKSGNSDESSQSKRMREGTRLRWTSKNYIRRTNIWTPLWQHYWRLR